MRHLRTEALLMSKSKGQRLSCSSSFGGDRVLFGFPFVPLFPPECWIGLKRKQDLFGFRGTLDLTLNFIGYEPKT